jgi:hypothetical protein
MWRQPAYDRRHEPRRFRGNRGKGHQYGDAWIRFLGRTTTAMLAAAGGLMAWSIGPLAIGVWLLCRRDL